MLFINCLKNHDTCIHWLPLRNKTHYLSRSNELKNNLNIKKDIFFTTRRDHKTVNQSMLNFLSMSVTHRYDPALINLSSLYNDMQLKMNYLIHYSLAISWYNYLFCVFITYFFLSILKYLLRSPWSWLQKHKPYDLNLK